MRELYLAGTQLAKDLAFCKLVDEIERNPMTRVIKKSEPCIVHEMTYAGRFYDRVDTGFTHIGYDLHYITFVYRGLMFNVEPATYYPFTDENNPGEFNFVPYVCRKFRKAQLDYRIAYEGIASLDAYLDSGRANRRTVQEPQLAVYGANQMSADWIVDRFGGIREKKHLAKLLLYSHRNMERRAQGGRMPEPAGRPRRSSRFVHDRSCNSLHLWLMRQYFFH